MESYDGSGLKDLRAYLARELRPELRNLRRFAWYHRGTLLAGLVLLAAGAAWLRPVPPPRAYLAASQPGSTFHAVAQRMQALFAQQGLELVLVENPGLERGFAQLRADGDPVDATFMTAGSKAAGEYRAAGEYEGVVSLGSIRHAPLWLFHRHTPAGPNPFVALSEQRIAIGMAGSATQAIFQDLLRANGRTLADAPRAQPLPDSEALERFRRGELDAVFLVDGVEADSVQRLLTLPEAKLLDFGTRQAYSRKIPYLTEVVLPQGSVDLKHMRPPTDVNLLSTSIALLVEETMHPAHQWAFLLAVQQLSRDRGSHFAAPGHFPSYLDKSVPLSPAARLFFDKGVPASFTYLPLWLASLYERLWLAVVALLAIALPAALAVHRVRELSLDRHVDGVYQRMFELGVALQQLAQSPPGESTQQRAECLAQFLAVQALAAPLVASDPRRFESLRKRWNDLVARAKPLFPESPPHPM